MTTGDVIRQSFPQTIDKTAEVFCALFANDSQTGTIESIFNAVEAERARWTAHKDVYEQEDWQSLPTLDPFAPFALQYGESVASFTRQCALLFCRGGDALWGTTHNVLRVIKAILQTDRVYLVNNTDDTSANLIVNGGFEKTGGWTLDECNIDKIACFEGSAGLSLEREGAAASQRVAVKAGTPYFLHFFLKGAVRVAVSADSGAVLFDGAFTRDKWDNESTLFFTGESDSAVTVRFYCTGARGCVDYVRMYEKTSASTFSIVAVFDGIVHEDTAKAAQGQVDPIVRPNYDNAIYSAQGEEDADGMLAERASFADISEIKEDVSPVYVDGAQDVIGIRGGYENKSYIDDRLLASAQGQRGLDGALTDDYASVDYEKESYIAHSSIFGSTSAQAADAYSALIDLLRPAGVIGIMEVLATEEQAELTRHRIDYTLDNMTATKEVSDVADGDIFVAEFTVDEGCAVQECKAECAGIEYAGVEVGGRYLLSIPQVVADVRVTARAARAIFAVQYDVQDAIVGTRQQSVQYGDALIVPLSVDDDHAFTSNPYAVMGGTLYNAEGGVITIPKVVADVVITARTRALSMFTVTDASTGFTYSGSESVRERSPFDCTLTLLDHHTVDVAPVAVMDGQWYAGVNTGDAWHIAIPDVTGDIEVRGAASLIGYAVTYNLARFTRVDGADVVQHGSAFTARLAMDSGSDCIECKAECAGVEYAGTIAGDEYVVTVPSVTGEVTVTAQASAKVFTVTYALEGFTYTGADTARYGDALTVNIALNAGRDVVTAPYATMAGQTVQAVDNGAGLWTLTIDAVTDAVTVAAMSDVSRVATPIITAMQAVTQWGFTITCATQGATIYYTLDGTEPTQTSPTLASGAAVVIDATGDLIIKAFAVKAGLRDSDIAVETYQYVAPTKTDEPLLHVSQHKDDWHVLISHSNANASIYITLDGSAPDTASTPHHDGDVIEGAHDSDLLILKAIATDDRDLPSDMVTVTAQFNPLFVTPQASTPTVQLNQRDDGWRLVIHPIGKADANPKAYYTLDGSKPNENSPFVTLTDYTVDTSALGTGDIHVRVYAIYDGAVKSDEVDITESWGKTDSATPAGTVFLTQNGVHRMQFTPVSGGMPANYYSTDGTEPTTDSPHASSIALDNPAQVRYLSVLSGNAANIVNVNYSLTSSLPAVDTPSVTIAQVGSTYEIQLACATDGATIHYTLDGTEATAASEAYVLGTNPQDKIIIPAASDMTVRAIAVHPDYNQSTEASASIVYTPLPQNAAPTVTATQTATGWNVKFVTNGTGDSIFYTTDGTEPTLASASVGNGTHTVAVAGKQDLTVKAIALSGNTSASDCVEAVFQWALAAPVVASVGIKSYEGDGEGTATITHADAEAVIHYTTDGTDPDENSHVATSGQAIDGITLPFTLKAIAVKAGVAQPSSVASKAQRKKLASTAEISCGIFQMLRLGAYVWPYVCTDAVMCCVYASATYAKVGNVNTYTITSEGKKYRTDQSSTDGIITHEDERYRIEPRIQFYQEEYNAGRNHSFYYFEKEGWEKSNVVLLDDVNNWTAYSEYPYTLIFPDGTTID